VIPWNGNQLALPAAGAGALWLLRNRAQLAAAYQVARQSFDWLNQRSFFSPDDYRTRTKPAVPVVATGVSAARGFRGNIRRFGRRRRRVFKKRRFGRYGGRRYVRRRGSAFPTMYYRSKVPMRKMRLERYKVPVVTRGDADAFSNYRGLRVKIVAPLVLHHFPANQSNARFIFTGFGSIFTMGAAVTTFPYRSVDFATLAAAYESYTMLGYRMEVFSLPSLGDDAMQWRGHAWSFVTHRTSTEFRGNLTTYDGTPANASVTDPTPAHPASLYLDYQAALVAPGYRAEKFRVLMGGTGSRGGWPQRSKLRIFRRYVAIPHQELKAHGEQNTAVAAGVAECSDTGAPSWPYTVQADQVCQYVIDGLTTGASANSRTWFEMKITGYFAFFEKRIQNAPAWAAKYPLTSVAVAAAAMPTADSLDGVTAAETAPLPPIENISSDPP